MHLRDQVFDLQARCSAVEGRYSDLGRKYELLMDYLGVEEVYTPPSNTLRKRKNPPEVSED